MKPQCLGLKLTHFGVDVPAGAGHCCPRGPGSRPSGVLLPLCAAGSGVLHPRPYSWGSPTMPQDQSRPLPGSIRKQFSSHLQSQWLSSRHSDTKEHLRRQLFSFQSFKRLLSGSLEKKPASPGVHLLQDRIHTTRSPCHPRCLCVQGPEICVPFLPHIPGRWVGC